VVTTNATLMLPARHSSAQASSVITITGIGDHDQPDWLITVTGIRTQMTLFQRHYTRLIGSGSAGLG
jgi:hypothetical protein